MFFWIKRNVLLRKCNFLQWKLFYIIIFKFLCYINFNFNLVKGNENSFFLFGIPEFLDSGRKCWTLDSGRWTPDAGLQTLDSGRRTLASGSWMLQFGRCVLDTGHFSKNYLLGNSKKSIKLIKQRVKFALFRVSVLV